MNDTMKDFLQSHRINIVNDNKRAHKRTRMNTKFFQFPEDYNILAQEAIDFDTEILYTIEIAESELERIAEFEAQVFNNLKQKGHYGMFEVLMQQKEHEKYLRNKYPAVNNAYKQYSLVLKLAESGEL